MAVQAGTGQLEIGFHAPPDVREALATLRRTEDVRFSPGGRRLAIACYAREQIAVADVEITVSASGPEIAVTSLDLLASPALREPHGLDWIDDETLIVANRGAGIATFRLPPAGAGGMTRTDSADGAVADLLEAPGSIAVHSPASGVHLALACDNRGNTITRHTLDATGALGAGEVVVRKWLDIPDGLALSQDGCWLAVSNHETHGVLLYEYARLGEDAEPVGVLRGVNFPHGIRFAEDDRYLVVADAGAPFVHVFAAHEGWGGVAYPAATMRVMDDETFLRGRHNPQEGGPKGIDVDPRSNVLAVTAECLPLAFFDLGPALAGEIGPADDALTTYELRVLEEGSATKKAAADQVSSLRAELQGLNAEIERIGAEAARLGATCEQLQTALAESNAALDHVHRSTSWRVTTPLRRLFDVARTTRQRLPRR